MACFGSALLGWIVAYAAYSAERRHTMEAFWREGIQLIVSLKKIKYLQINAPLELVGACFDEEFGFDNSESSERHEAKQKMLMWIKERFFPDDAEEDYEDAIGRYYHSLMNEYQKNTNTSANTYIEFSEKNVRDFINAYSKLDFIFANRTIRKDAYEKIFRPVYDFYLKCCEEAVSISKLVERNYISGECLGKVFTLQKEIFIEDDGKIYLRLSDDLERALETFRSKIYGVSPEYHDPVPVNLLFFEDSLLPRKMAREDVSGLTMNLYI